MKKIITTISMLALVMGSTKTIAQNVAINSTGAAPNSTAMLDVSSTTQGLLAPRMTSAQRAAIGSPATGLLVYQTDGTAGFYYYDGAGWVMMITGNASNLTSGTVGTARLGSGTADNTTYLRGDGTWSSVTATFPTVVNAETSFSVSCTGSYTTLATVTIPSTGKYLLTVFMDMPVAAVTLKSRVTQGGTVKAGTSAYASDLYGSVSHVLNLTTTTDVLIQAAVDVPFGGASPQTVTGTYSLVKLAN